MKEKFKKKKAGGKLDPENTDRHLQNINGTQA
jgi:hypothetical protein